LIGRGFETWKLWGRETEECRRPRARIRGEEEEEEDGERGDSFSHVTMVALLLSLSLILLLLLPRRLAMPKRPYPGRSALPGWI
jgi:hypothetical protein